jgi:predicted DNA-binding antitoxin AbrB/MazE fold protein
MTTVLAVYENGMFRPIQPVQMKEGETVELTVVPRESSPSGKLLDELDTVNARGSEFVSGKPSPEVLEWARRQHSPEQVIAMLREMEQSGGLELKEFIADLERAANAP